MSDNQSGFSKPVIWGGATLVILFGFIVMPAAIWILPFKWLEWPKWILIPMCAVGTFGYFLTAWYALQWLARGGVGAEPDLELVEQPNGDASPEQTSEAARAVYEEVLDTEEDPYVRQVVQDALDRTEGKGTGGTHR